MGGENGASTGFAIEKNSPYIHVVHQDTLYITPCVEFQCML